jgi:hypothetical protein
VVKKALKHLFFSFRILSKDLMDICIDKIQDGCGGSGKERTKEGRERRNGR